MGQSPVIEFWFTMGSTYTYLAASRLADVERESGVKFRWRPFDFRTLLQEMNYFPFPEGAAKTAYMWRDIERRTAMYRLPMRRPVPYPIKDSFHANCVALLGMQEGWGHRFVPVAYRRWFAFGEENGGEANVRAALAELGQDYDRAVAAVGSERVHDDLKAQTEEARRLHLFGSPIFVVDGEMFWGDDRLDDAVSWARHGRVVRSH